MIVGRLYISTYDNIIVSCTKDKNQEHFEGIIIDNAQTEYKINEFKDCWYKNSFKLYTSKDNDLTQIGGEHYSKNKIQPIDYILANDMDFVSGNIIKYVTRYKHKNGLEDLKKAKHYLEILINNYEVSKGVE